VIILSRLFLLVQTDNTYLAALGFILALSVLAIGLLLGRDLATRLSDSVMRKTETSQKFTLPKLLRPLLTFTGTAIGIALASIVSQFPLTVLYLLLGDSPPTGLSWLWSAGWFLNLIVITCGALVGRQIGVKLSETLVTDRDGG
jgi:uncharacterized membrane protein YqgA involved in biofilm formation